jgi:hypothetical protein
MPSHTLCLRYTDDQHKSAAIGCLIDFGIQSDNLLDSPISGQTKAQFTELQIIINFLKSFGLFTALY